MKTKKKRKINDPQHNAEPRMMNNIDTTKRLKVKPAEQVGRIQEKKQKKTYRMAIRTPPNRKTMAFNVRDQCALYITYICWEDCIYTCVT